MAILSPEAQTWKRIFTMLYMLRDDFAWQVHNSKQELQKYKGTIGETPAKDFHKMNAQNHQDICNLLNRIHFKAKSKASRDIVEELTSERIKDLHYGIDTMLEIENIADICKLLSDNMIPTTQIKN